MSYSSLPNKRSAIFINFCQNLMRNFYLFSKILNAQLLLDCATFAKNLKVKMKTHKVSTLMDYFDGISWLQCILD